MVASDQVEAAMKGLHAALASEWMTVATALDGDQGRYESLLRDLAEAALRAAESDRWLDARDAEQQRIGAVRALRLFAARANDAGVLGDPTYWFPVRDSVRAEADRIEEKGRFW